MTDIIISRQESGDLPLSRRRLALNLILTLSRNSCSLLGWRILVLRRLSDHFLETHTRIMVATAFQSGADHRSFRMDNPYAASRFGPRTLHSRNLLSQQIRDSRKTHKEEWGERRRLTLATGSTGGWHISRPRYHHDTNSSFDLLHTEGFVP